MASLLGPTLDRSRVRTCPRRFTCTRVLYHAPWRWNSSDRVKPVPWKRLNVYQGTVPREYSSTSWVSRSKASDHCLSVSIPKAEVKRQNPKRQASANRLRVAGSLDSYLYHHADHVVTLRYSGTLVLLEVYHLAVQWNSPMQQQNPGTHSQPIGPSNKLKRTAQSSKFMKSAEYFQTEMTAHL